MENKATPKHFLLQQRKGSFSGSTQTTRPSAGSLLRHDVRLLLGTLPTCDGAEPGSGKPPVPKGVDGWTVSKRVGRSPNFLFGTVSVFQTGYVVFCWLFMAGLFW